jgi:hypothetical protein
VLVGSAAVAAMLTIIFALVSIIVTCVAMGSLIMRFVAERVVFMRTVIIVRFVLIMLERMSIVLAVLLRLGFSSLLLNVLFLCSIPNLMDHSVFGSKVNLIVSSKPLLYDRCSSKAFVGLVAKLQEFIVVDFLSQRHDFSEAKSF